MLCPLRGSTGRCGALVSGLGSRLPTKGGHHLSSGSAHAEQRAGGFVFTVEDGRPIDPERPTKAFGRIGYRERLPHLRLHGLRHVSATLMLKSGVHPKVVSERLGHAGIAITLDIYSHVISGLQEAAALALDQELAGGLEAASY